jgi:opacity protein-like surface antigen
MKILLASILLLCAACSTAKPRIDLLAGDRDFDSRGEWEQTDQQTAVGIQVSFTEPNGFGPEIAYIHSDDTSKDGQYVNRPVDFTKSRIEELSIGLRKNFMLSDSFQVYVSGGLSATMLETSADLTYARAYTDNSVAYSPYAQAGLSYLFNENWSCGLMYRRSFWGEDEDIFINEPPTDSNLFMLTVGYSF